MTVYVDDYFAPYRRMLMCHMVANTEEELHAMAEALDLKRQWYQGQTRGREHYDICASKRKLAIKLGAVAIPYRVLAVMTGVRSRSDDGYLPSPEAAELLTEERKAAFDKLRGAAK